MSDAAPSPADVIDQIESVRFLSRNRKSASVGVAFLALIIGPTVAILLAMNNSPDLATAAGVLGALTLLGGIGAGAFFTFRERSARKKLIGLNQTTPFASLRIAPFREGVRLGDSVVVTFGASTVKVAYGPGEMYARIVRVAALVAGLAAVITGLACAQSSNWLHPAVFWGLAGAGLLAAAWTMLPATFMWEADRGTQTLTTHRIKWLFASDSVAYGAHECQTLECYGPLVRLRTTRGKARLLSLGLPDRHNVGHAIGGVAVAVAIKDGTAERAHQDLCAWRTRRLAAALSVMLGKRLDVDVEKAGMWDVLQV